MAYEIYTKLTTLYLAELDRLENNLVRAENLLTCNGFDNGAMVNFINAKAEIEYFKKFMGDVLDYVKRFEG